MEEVLRFLINIGIVVLGLAGVYGLSRGIPALWFGAGAAEVALWFALSRLKPARRRP